MKWEDALQLGPTALSRILGCPTTTANAWIHRSGPPEWQKQHFLAAIKAAGKIAVKKRGRPPGKKKAAPKKKRGEPRRKK